MQHAPRRSAPEGELATRVTTTKTPESITIRIATSVDALLKDLCGLTGTHNEAVAARILQQVANCLNRTTPQDAEGAVIQAVGTIAEMAPQNLTEAMLAAQMIATHETALKFLGMSTLRDQPLEGVSATALWATRLMRLHLEQIEAMQKLKGKAGQQKVTVEHVHVYQGGQAIVGAVNPAKNHTGGGG